MRRVLVAAVSVLAGCVVLDPFPELARDVTEPSPLGADADAAPLADASTTELPDASAPGDADGSRPSGAFRFAVVATSDDTYLASGPMVAVAPGGGAAFAFTSMGNWKVGGAVLPGPQATGRMDYGVVHLGDDGGVRSAVRVDLGAMDYVGTLAFDPAGALWIAGHTYESVTETSITHPVVARVDAQGRPSLSVTIDAVMPSSWGIPRAIRIGPNGHVAVALDYVGTLEYTRTDGSVVGVTSTSPSSAPYVTDDVLVARIDPASGRVIWARSIGGVAFDSVRDLAVDAQGAVYVAGALSSDALAFPAVTRIGTRPNAFVAKLAADDGNEVWAHGWGDAVDPAVAGPGESQAAASRGGVTSEAIAVDGSGHVAVGGAYRGTVDFSGDLRSADLPGFFVVLLDASTGARTWSRYGRGTSTSGGVVNGLAFDAVGSLGVSATAKSATTGGTGSFAGKAFAASGTSMLVAKMKVADGEVTWMKSIVASAGTVLAQGIALTPGGRVFAGTTARGTADVGTGTPIASPSFGGVVAWEP